ncbi:MAG TPA: oligosaccharide flippase family protein, partial [Burkholderiales bacterium]|nr:oligosaccharide flippase family protein [Burkholderiales bacterium]
MKLGTANAVDAAIQLLTPIVLVRVLDGAGFGEYRLLWLAAGTLLAIVPMGMSASLGYFLPRHPLRAQAVFVRQTLLFMAVAGILAGLLLGPWNPLLPESIKALASAHYAAPLFWGLWILGSTLDLLPAAERRFGLQAGLILALALVRGAAVIAAAVLGGIDAVIAVLALLAAVKVFLLLGLSTARYGRRLWLSRMPKIVEQARFALPMGAGDAVYLLRVQADQWLVVILFGAAQYGVYSLGALALSVAGILRHSVNEVIFPEMSKAQGDGDLRTVLSLNNRSNIACALFIVPASLFLLAAAGPLVRLLYTDAYADAIPVLQLNVIAYLIATVEVSTLMLVLRQGPYLLYTSIAFLVLSLLVSYAGAQVWGMTGAVLGAIVGNLVAIVVLYARVSRLVAIPVSKLQDWGTLARIGASGAVAAAAAYATVFLAPPALGNIVVLVLAG